jgi:4-amino-4-deoxy-L-arabinose transferase-like glycosyltransferase
MNTVHDNIHESVPRADYFDVLQLTLVFCLGAALRFVGLAWESLWYDEACSLDMASASLADIISGNIHTPGNPFGYFALLRIWCEQFGFDIESARAMSAFFGTLVIPATWLAASRMTSERQVSLWAAFLVAVSPPMVFLSREARVYPLLALFVVLSAMYASDIIRSQSRHGWFGLTITCAALPHLHYYAFFFLAVIGGLLLWFSRAALWPTLYRLLLFYAAVAFAFLPGLRLFLTQLEIVQEVAVNSLMQVLSFPVFVLGDRTFVWKQDGAIWLGLGAFLTVFGVWLPVFRQLRKDPHAPWLALATSCSVFLLAVAVSGLYMSMFNARYVSFIVPLLLIVVSYAMTHSLRNGNWSSAIPAILLGVITCISLVRMYTEPQKDDWRSLSQYIAAHGPHVPVVFYEDIGATTFKYFRPDQPFIQLFEEFDGDGQAWSSAGYGKTLSELPDYWLVVTPIWTNEIPEQVVQWCSQFGTLVDQQSFKGLRLIRFSNTNMKATLMPPGGGTPSNISPYLLWRPEGPLRLS